MKYKGQRPGPNIMELFLPRGDNPPIIIRAQSVLTYDEFHKIFPMPTPPKKRMKGSMSSVPDFDDKNYIKAMDAYGTAKSNWMFLESLKATPEIEWEQVDPMNPQTWALFQKELEEAGFCEFERQRIMGLVMEANALNDRKIEEAREAFLTALTNPTDQESSSPKVEA